MSSSHAESKANKKGATKGAKAPKKAPASEEKKKRHHSRLPRLCFQPNSIYKVLKQVLKQKETEISSQAMKSLVGITGGLAEKIAQQAVDLCHASNKKTLTSAAVQSAVRLCFPGELAKHGVSEGAKAVVKSIGGVREKGDSQTKRAGLQLSVGRARRILKAFHSGHIGRSAPVYLAAVVEYIVTEVMEISAEAMEQTKRKGVKHGRITNRHLDLAVRNDEELDRLFKHVTFASGGVLPNIHAALLPKKGKKSE